jgi:UDP-N-acetylglucosamine 2-epimerase (non-hydrolysing)
VTLHRPSNVDDPRMLRGLLSALDEVAQRLRLVFPVHPRTRARLAATGIELAPERWTPLAPSATSSFLALQSERARGADRLGRRSGRDDRAGRSVRHAARKHRAAVHGLAGHQRDRGTPAETASCAPSRRRFRKRPRGGRVPALWDGKARAVVEILARQLRDDARAA